MESRMESVVYETSGVLAPSTGELASDDKLSFGNGTDFGDLSESRFYLVRGCISNGHGGLG